MFYLIDQWVLWYRNRFIERFCSIGNRMVRLAQAEVTLGNASIILMMIWVAILMLVFSSPAILWYRLRVRGTWRDEWYEYEPDPNTQAFHGTYNETKERVDWSRQGF